MTDQSITRRNIGVLTAAQALGGASAPIVMSLGGLVGQQLAKNSAWITLPVSLFGLGLAIGTLPAAFIMRHHGRRNGYVVGVGFGVASAAIGLVPGTAFSLRSCAPFNGPLRLTYAGHDEVLGYELASAIWVQRAAPAA